MKVIYEVADIFCKFKAWVENQSSFNFRVNRFYNGLNTPLTILTSDSVGFEHQLIAPYTAEKMRWLRENIELLWR